MPLVIHKTHPFRVDFFPRRRRAGAEFAVAIGAVIVVYQT